MSDLGPPASPELATPVCASADPRDRAMAHLRYAHAWTLTAANYLAPSDHKGREKLERILVRLGHLGEHIEAQR